MPTRLKKPAINLDLLRPQGNAEKIHIRLTRWLLSTGRYILIFVELIVLLAFLARFKLDADLAATKEAAEEQIPYIESLRPYEILIRETQLKLASIKSFNQTSPDFSSVLRDVAAQTPQNVKIDNMTLEKNVGKVDIRINGQTQNSSELSSFLKGLNESPNFTDINLGTVGLIEGVITFTITGSSTVQAQGEKSL